MREYRHILQPMYTDYYCNASPGELARIIIGDTVLQMDADGIPRQRLIDEKKGAWMADKFRLRMFSHVTYMQELTVRMSQRREKGVRIYYTADVMCGSRCAASADICFFAVEFETRRIIRLRDIDHLWNCPALPGENMEKAVCRGDMVRAAEETVRFSDCDSNRHMSSPKYLDLVCDVTGYWAEREKLCSLMQVDFVSECRPGERLELLTAQEDGLTYVRGVKADGTSAFDAVCSYC